MKIKISANSHLPHLEKVSANISYGYSSLDVTKETLTKENSWGIKILSSIDGFLGKVRNISDTHQEVTHGILSATQFLDTHVDRHEYLNNMSVNINVKSYLNTILKGALSISHLLPKISNLDSIPSFNDQAASIHIASRKIFIGTDFFTKQQNNFNLGFELKETLGLEKAINFIVFHEASHSFQYTNSDLYSYDRETSETSSFGIQKLISFTEICNIAKILSDEKKCDISNYMLELTDNEDLARLNHNFMFEIKTLHGEIYADAGAILIQRNADILNGTYKKEDTIEYIESIIKGRNAEHEEKLTIYENNQNIYTSNFNHFTSPGITYLKDNIDSLPERVLSLEEIHYYSNKAVIQGMARVLITTAYANEDNNKQIKTLLNLRLDLDKNSNLDIQYPNKKSFTTSDDTYTDKMSALEILAGESWSIDFQKKIVERKKLTAFNMKLDIWNLGLIPQTPSSVKLHNLEENFNTNVPIEPLSKNTEFSQKNTVFIPKKFKGILSDIGKLRDKAFSTHSDNNNSNTQKKP